VGQSPGNYADVKVRSATADASPALLKIWPALWTFAYHRGIEPTNNNAERALRGAVIYRKLSLAAEDGERRIARLLPAHTTCRLQRGSPHEYLIDTCSAPKRAATQSRCSPDPHGA